MEVFLLVEYKSKYSRAKSTRSGEEPSNWGCPLSSGHMRCLVADTKPTAEGHEIFHSYLQMTKISMHFHINYIIFLKRRGLRDASSKAVSHPNNDLWKLTYCRAGRIRPLAAGPPVQEKGAHPCPVCNHSAARSLSARWPTNYTCGPYNLEP